MPTEALRGNISEELFTQADTGVAGPLTRVHHMPFGAEVLPGGGVRFRLFAPAAENVAVAFGGVERHAPMEAVGDGWFELVSEQARPGTQYRFVLPDGTHVPDPASRFQPDDVSGPSEVIAPGSYTWKDGKWAGMPWYQAVIYELHIGAFTPEGTFRAAIGKLDHLADLGVTLIEIMPVGDFAGNRGWGYDGVLWYAPDASYGRPDDLKALVEAAHARGMGVMLDVVYNHFGPEGNYIQKYFPNLLTEAHKTSWGAAVNYDDKQSDVVRALAIHNAMYWLEEFHLDGLRLDAVHAIMDSGPKHLLTELAERVAALNSPYPLHLVLENEKNEAFRLTRDADGRPEHFSAQWNDDMHHVLHTAATHEDAGYYADYVDNATLLGRALAEGFAYQGQASVCTGKQRGEPCSHLPPDAFVSFIQNHDQIGNRAFGERIGHITDAAALKALVSVYLLLPQIPLIFMGEEWAASTPFPYFCDFHGELADLVRKGRRDEFKKFPEFQDPAKRDTIPDPLAESTYESAKLKWDERDGTENRECMTRHCQLIALRRTEIIPLLGEIEGNAGSFDVVGPGAVVVRWTIRGGRELRLAANLCDRAKEGFPTSEGRVLWHQGPELEGSTFGPWTVQWMIKDA